jgi:hypothetical protein
VQGAVAVATAIGAAKAIIAAQRLRISLIFVIFEGATPYLTL